MKDGDKYKREPQNEAPFLLCLQYPQQPAHEDPEGSKCDCKDELLTLVVATHNHHTPLYASSHVPLRESVITPPALKSGPL